MVHEDWTEADLAAVQELISARITKPWRVESAQPVSGGIQLWSFRRRPAGPRF